MQDNNNQEEQSSSLSDTDINEILESMGVSETSLQEETNEAPTQNNPSNFTVHTPAGDVRVVHVSYSDDTDNYLEASLVSPEESQEQNTSATNSETIQENPKSLEVDETTSRFSSAIWYDKIKQQKVHIVGIGGIGSYVGFLLGRMKLNTVFIQDPDTVDSSNMSGQFYTIDDIGNTKTSSLTKNVRLFSNFYNIISTIERFTSNSEVAKITICGLDNMETRKNVYNNWKRKVMEQISPEIRKECLFIDGRLAAEEFQVFCIKGDDSYSMQRYEKDWLFSDDEAEETICSYKQTSYMANMIGSVIVNLFVNFIANKCNPIIERDLPFFTSYNAETMFFKTII